MHLTNTHTHTHIPNIFLQPKQIGTDRQTDKNGNIQVDVEGISVVYSEAFQGLFRLSISFLPLSFGVLFFNAIFPPVS